MSKIYYKTIKSSELSHRVNEDSCYIEFFSVFNDASCRLLMIADGMGGLEHGDQASRLAVKQASKVFHDTVAARYLEPHDGDYSIVFDSVFIKQTLVKAIKEANRAVIEGREEMTISGTTLSILAVVDGYTVVASIGDSPVYYYSAAEDAFELVSEIQTQAEYDVARGLYERYSDEYIERSYKLRQCLGVRASVDAEDIHIRLIGYPEEGDMLLMGSDGAFGHLRDRQIEQIIRNVEPKHIISALFEAAVETKSDDQTAILYCL